MCLNLLKSLFFSMILILISKIHWQTLLEIFTLIIKTGSSCQVSEEIKIWWISGELQLLPLLPEAILLFQFLKLRNIRYFQYNSILRKIYMSGELQRVGLTKVLKYLKYCQISLLNMRELIKTDLTVWNNWTDWIFTTSIQLQPILAI